MVCKRLMVFLGINSVVQCFKLTGKYLLKNTRLSQASNRKVPRGSKVLSGMNLGVLKFPSLSLGGQRASDVLRDSEKGIVEAFWSSVDESGRLVGMDVVQGWPPCTGLRYVG